MSKGTLPSFPLINFYFFSRSHFFPVLFFSVSLFVCLLFFFPFISIFLPLLFVYLIFFFYFLLIFYLFLFFACTSSYLDLIIFVWSFGDFCSFVFARTSLPFFLLFSTSPTHSTPNTRQSSRRFNGERLRSDLSSAK